MGSSNAGRYRLEVAIKRIHDLAELSVNSRIVFSARFLNFDEIFIRPHTASGGGVAETSPDNSRIVSLTYNVCHRADFILSDDECRQLFPANCSFSVFDESLPDAPMRWTCPCPLTTSEGAAAGWHYSSYAMQNASGQVMGFANMSCRVVALDAAIPHGVAQTAGAITSSAAASPTVSGPNITSNGGKSYVIRVVLDDHLNVNEKKRKNILPAVELLSSSTRRVAPSPQKTIPPFQNDSSLEVEEKVNTVSTRKVQAASRSRGNVKKTLLYVLQYDVAYQIQSNCSILYATLKREFTSLNAVSVSEKAKLMTTKVDNMVQSICRLANIALQLVNQLVELSGETYTDIISDPKGRRNPVNKLSVPSEGSVAHFIIYQVLFQLQCLGTNLCHVTSVYEHTLEVPLTAFHHQHYSFICRLRKEARDLSKYINIIVQSTIDGSFGLDSTQTYSSSFSSTCGKSSRLSSVSSRSSVGSSIKSVHTDKPAPLSASATKRRAKHPTLSEVSQANTRATHAEAYTPPFNTSGNPPFSPSVSSVNTKAEGLSILPNTLQLPSPQTEKTTTTTNAEQFQAQQNSTISSIEHTGTTPLSAIGIKAETSLGIGTGLGTGTSVAGMGLGSGTGVGLGTGTSVAGVGLGSGTAAGLGTGTAAVGVGLGSGTGADLGTGTSAVGVGLGSGTGVGLGTGTSAAGVGLGPGTGTGLGTGISAAGVGLGSGTGAGLGTATPAVGVGLGSGPGTATPAAGVGLGSGTGAGLGTATPAVGVGLGSGPGTATPAAGVGLGSGTGTFLGSETMGVPSIQFSPLPPAISSVRTSSPSPMEPSRSREVDNILPIPTPLASESTPQKAPELNATLPNSLLEPSLPSGTMQPSAIQQPVDLEPKLTVDQLPVQVPLSLSKSPSVGTVLDSAIPSPVGVSSLAISHSLSAPSPPAVLGNDHLQMPSSSFTPSQSVPLSVPLPIPTMPN